MADMDDLEATEGASEAAAATTRKSVRGQGPRDIVTGTPGSSKFGPVPKNWDYSPKAASRENAINRTYGGTKRIGWD